MSRGKELLSSEKVNPKFLLWLFTLVILFILLLGILIKGYYTSEETSVQVISEKVLIPGGQSVGIQMDVKGALIVGTQRKFGPEPGDKIVEIGGKPIKSAKDAQNIVCKTSKKIKIKVIRKSTPITFFVKPNYDAKTRKYKLGLWVKEKIAGIGTLTFYDPMTNTFACLGHGIYENKTNTLLDVKKGSLLNTSVKKITEGEKGKPGEIGGLFYNCDKPVGKILKNTKYGIYGDLNTSKFKMNTSQPMVMGNQDQIKRGKAYILTTISGSKVERFNIKITKINRQNEVDSKGIEFEVTDKKLISKCGGIVQGMSGSPIIQNNRIIGAVTHVLVNEPTKGYGIFTEWMIKQAE